MFKWFQINNNSKKVYYVKLFIDVKSQVFEKITANIGRPGFESSSWDSQKATNNTEKHYKVWFTLQIPVYGVKNKIST